MNTKSTVIMKFTRLLFFTSFLIFLGASCSSSDDEYNQPGGETPGEETPALDQTEIRSKIVEYYSSPSTSSNSVTNIQTAFAGQFPNSTDIEWKVSNGIYELDFEINRVDYEAWYDSNANLLMYKHDIANNELPSSVSSAIAVDYPGYILDDAEKVYKGTLVGYYVDLDKNKIDVHAFYDENGTFISQTLWEDDTVKPANDAEVVTPEISGSYSDEQVDAFISAYYSGNDNDVLPSNVPTAILSNFNSVFTNARDIDWELASEIYKVDFEINNVDYDAWYHQDGTLLAYKFDITRSSLPQAVTATISTQFAGYGIDDAEKVVKINSVGYFVELENRNVEEDAYYAEDGTYISNLFYTINNNPGNVEPPVTPEIPSDGNYTDAEIDALLLTYQQGRDQDINASNVPTSITTAFNTQFVSARDIDWEYVGNIYKVEFEISGIDYEAWYVDGGTLLMYTQEVRYSSVASVVQSAILSQYPEYTIDGCDYFQKGTIKGYIIELENNRTGAELIVLYQENGTFIHQQFD